jgi:hypothetical protein
MSSSLAHTCDARHEQPLHQKPGNTTAARAQKDPGCAKLVHQPAGYFGCGTMRMYGLGAVQPFG